MAFQAWKGDSLRRTGPYEGIELDEPYARLFPTARALGQAAVVVPAMSIFPRATGGRIWQN